MHATKRFRLPSIRHGKTHKLTIGDVTLYVTVNVDSEGLPRELFIKADKGWQGWADCLALTASLALQHGCPIRTIVRQWAGMKFPPDGLSNPSVPDAVARLLMSEFKELVS